jgi:hypothetical protein
MNTRSDASERRSPLRSKNSTAGLSASERKRAIRIHVMMCHARKRNAMIAVAERMMPRTTRIARGRKETRRSSTCRSSAIGQACRSRRTEERTLRNLFAGF